LKFISYILFRFSIGVFSLIPFKLLYIFSDFIRFFLKNVFKYRLDVIQKNISHCFGHTHSEDQQKEIVDKFYKNFIDILLESFKSLSYKPTKLISRFKLQNPELIDQHFDDNQNVIIYSQHYNNWEWGPITLGHQMKHHIVGIVKLISNGYINNYMINGRSKTNVSVVPTGQTHDYFSKLHTIEKPQGIVFIADQSPYGGRKTSLEFFGNPTEFHNGAAIYAVKTQYPVYTLDVIRVGRGKYHVKAYQISEGNEDLTPEELTGRYASHLEDLIRQQPEAWLWSHKRFKNSIKY